MNLRADSPPQTSDFKAMIEELRWYARQIIALRSILRHKGIHPDDLVNDVILHELEKPTIPKALHDRKNYLKTCIKNRSIDLIRKIIAESKSIDAARSWPAQHQANPTLGAATECESVIASAEALKTLLSQSLALLNAAAPSLIRASGVNYFAVLMFQLRLVLAIKLKPGPGDSPADARDPSVSDLAALLVPWGEALAESSFRRGLPDLDRSWQAIRQSLDTPTLRTTIFDFCTAFNDLQSPADKTFRLTPALWYQWVKRAKNLAKETIAPNEWNRCLSHWLPDRSSDQSP